MRVASSLKNFTYRHASALLRISTAALLILAPVALASAQSSGPPSDNAAAGRPRPDTGATIGPDSESDPVSLEAIQEGVKNFELRREMDGKPLDAANAAAVAERRARDANKSDEKAEDKTVPPGERKPPHDAVPHQGVEATTIQTEAPSRPLSVPKVRAKPPADYPSRGERNVPPQPVEPYRIGFSESTTTPAAGIDPRIRSDLAVGERGETYAFLLTKTLPDAAVAKEALSLVTTEVKSAAEAAYCRNPRRLLHARQLVFAQVDPKDDSHIRQICFRDNSRIFRACQARTCVCTTSEYYAYA